MLINRSMRCSNVELFFSSCLRSSIFVSFSERFTVSRFIMGSRKKSKGKTSRSKSKRCKRNQSISAASLSRASLAKGSMCKGAMAQGLSMGPGAGGPAPAGTFAEQSQQAMCPQCAIMVQTQTTPTVGICTYALCVVTIP